MRQIAATRRRDRVLQQIGLGGKRGAGVPGYGVRGPGEWKTRGVENTGCGKHGVWWKARGLVENTGSKWKTRGLSAKHSETIISPNN